MLPGDVQLEMLWIEPGTFMMGRYSDEQDSFSFSNEDPQHEATLTQGFWMGKYELTKAQWTAVMGTTPWGGMSELDNADSPATFVSWNDAQAFITVLNDLTSKTFRLPTEAEWEYACRAGTSTEYYFGDSSTNLSDYAWWDGNAWSASAGERYAHVVGQKLANALGLFDTRGNVWDGWEARYGACY